MQKKITITKTKKFWDHVKRASEIVSKWPQWKKDVMRIKGD